MGFFRGPNIVTAGLKFAIDAGSERSYPRLTPAAVWYDYSGGLAAGRYTIENSVQPYTIRLNTTFASWVGQYQITVPSAEKYTIMFDYVADASSSLVLDNDGIDDNNWNATISVTTTVQTYKVTKAVTTTGIIKFYTRRVNGGNITVSNFRFFKSDPVKTLVGTNNGTLTNGVKFNTANGGNFEFDGTDDHINIGAGTGLNQYSGDFAISVWVKRLASGSSYGTIIGDYYTGSVQTTNEWQIMIGPASQLLMYRVGSGSFLPPTASGFSSGTWINVVVTRSGSTCSIYANANLIVTATNSTTFGTSTGNLNIGIDGNNSSEPFPGNIAALQIRNNSTLTAAQVLQNYNAQKSRFI